jgi:hypothetical protein
MHLAACFESIGQKINVDDAALFQSRARQQADI